MSSVANDAADRLFMWRVLSAWLRDRPRESTGDRLLDAHLDTFSALEADTLMQAVRRQGLPINVGPDFGWLVGRPLARANRPTVPVAAIQLDGDHESVTRLSARVALLQCRNDSTVHASGWRFELAERSDDTPCLHPYHHAQAIVGWDISSTCLIHPSHDDVVTCHGTEPTGDTTLDDDRVDAIGLVHQSHPAFPLATNTLTGLAAAILTTLYGAPRATAIINTDAALLRADGQPGGDLARLLAW